MASLAPFDPRTVAPSHRRTAEPSNPRTLLSRPHPSRPAATDRRGAAPASQGALLARAVRQLEYEHRRAPVGWIPDFRHERRERIGLSAAIADHDREVLPAVHRVADRSVARYVAQARPPQFPAG